MSRQYKQFEFTVRVKIRPLEFVTGRGSALQALKLNPLIVIFDNSSSAAGRLILHIDWQARTTKVLFCQ
jgi:hypothetical protein